MGFPEDMDLPEDVVAKIVGSRQSILFVEGDRGGFDVSVYRRIYSDFTVIAVGGCDAVIHAVSTFNRQASLHRLGCAGLIDADGRSAATKRYLSRRGIEVLPVAEVENLFALPSVFNELAKLHHFDEQQIADLRARLEESIYRLASDGIDGWAVEATKRELDRQLKTVGLTSDDPSALSAEFVAKIRQIDPAEIFRTKKESLQSAVRNRDFSEVLRIYDNKAVLNEIVRLLRLRDRRAIEEMIGRALRSDAGKELRAAMKRALPALHASAEPAHHAASGSPTPEIAVPAKSASVNASIGGVVAVANVGVLASSVDPTLADTPPATTG